MDSELREADFEFHRGLRYDSLPAGRGPLSQNSGSPF